MMMVVRSCLAEAMSSPSSTITPTSTGQRPELARLSVAARCSIHARKAGWTFLVHHTDRPAAEPMLVLHSRLSGHLMQDGKGDGA